ncbi:MAG: DUF2799 domain-containing protein [Bdellovibrionota bacterium]
MPTLALLLLVLSCSSMDREKCLSADWYQEGVKDASDRGEDHFLQYKRECGKEGISIVDGTGPYKKGILEGLRTWCSFKNGFNQGLAGRSDTSRCEGINPAFIRGYEEGFREFREARRRKLEEEKWEKRYADERGEFRTRILSRSKTKECSVDSDCRTEGECRFNRCTHNNLACSYSYECKVTGQCREINEQAKDRTVLTIRVCDYGNAILE